MAHPRTAVRHAVIATLEAVPGLDVRAGRLGLTEMPKNSKDVVAVANASERSEPAPRCGPRRRLLQLTVYGLARERQRQDIEETVDALTEKMERALDADPTLGGLVIHLDLTSTEFDIAAVDGAAGVAIQTWTMRIV